MNAADIINHVTAISKPVCDTGPENWKGSTVTNFFPILYKHSVQKYIGELN